MSKRFCKCPNDHCFYRTLQCGSCDPEDLDPKGFSKKARRRLTNEENGMVQDVDDKQWFKVKKVKGGKRLVPQFKGPVDWKSTKGFAAMCVILSCLGVEGEYVLWDEATETAMTEKEWRRRKFRSTSKPPVRHGVCEEVVTSTSIHDLQRGQGIGCGCNSNHVWRHRRPEVVQFGDERGFEVLTTEKEWADECTGGHEYCPTLKCVECNEVVTSTNVHNLQRGHGIGCRCKLTMANQWRHRRPEVVQFGDERGFEVLTTEKEWVDECTGPKYCPTFKCVECKEVVTSTCITSLRNGGRIGCSCRNKTEAKLRPWLEKKHPEATVNTQYRGPKTDRNGQTHFDFHLTFPDGFEVLIELDGPQHFWSDRYNYTDEACERDLLKEKWAIAKGLSVVRVLQEDVWEDRPGWETWLTKSIEAARSGEPRVFTPIAPEYRSVDSAYVQLRSPG